MREAGMKRKRFEKAQLEKLYLENHKKVFFAAFSQLNNKHIAEDIMQTTFCKLLASHDYPEDNTHVKAWLLTVAVNEAKNYKKKQAKEVLKEDIGFCSLNCSSVEDDFFCRYKVEEQKRLGSIILRTLQELNTLWYEAIILVYILRIPQKIIAQQLGISERALHSRLFRAREWIKKNYKELYDNLD
ncbi:MAG: RNA polymerase sigma factor, partial [Lachnospiraceae bacterium]|nr:RNA polymerase sigma factor [Lachnospiraceae bacterium]